jgi:CheY-specific phosphatase CheX
VATLTGLNPSEISKSVMVDGICELANMIAGAAKASLDATQMQFDMTLPVSFLGEDISVGVKAGMPGGVLRCSWASETFQLGIWRAKEA